MIPFSFGQKGCQDKRGSRREVGQKSEPKEIGELLCWAMALPRPLASGMILKLLFTASLESSKMKDGVWIFGK